MNYLHLLASFASGLFVCNAIPHLTAGLRGERFPTPFATPPGKGKSSSAVNALWGTGNLAVGCLLWPAALFPFGLNLATLLFFLGFGLMGLMLAHHFEAVRSGGDAK
jgi:hypothetical protein